MARIRTVKPELHSSPSLAQCSIEARWTFVGLFTLADDEGRIRDLPRQIVGALFPLDDDITVVMVVEWLDELEAVDCIRRYTVDGSAFLYLPGWTAHQKISKPTPSRIPAPPGVAHGIPGIPVEVNETPGGSQLEVEVGILKLEREMEIGFGAGDAREPGQVVHRSNPLPPAADTSAPIVETPTRPEEVRGRVDDLRARIDRPQPAAASIR